MKLDFASQNKEAKSSPHHGVRILLRKTRRIVMKKLEIIIKPEKLEDLKEVLDSCEVNGMNIVNTGV